MGFKIATDIIFPTTWTQTAAASDATYPASNLGIAASPALIERPFLPWRSGTLAGTDPVLVADFGVGASHSIYAMFFNNPNWSVGVIETAPNSGVYDTTLPMAPGSDTRVGRRKIWREPTSPPYTSRRYIRVTIDRTSVPAGVTYAELGAVAVLRTVTVLPDYVSAPFAYTIRQAATFTELGGGGVEVNAEGAVHLEYDFKNPTWKKSGTSILTDLHALVTAGVNAPIVMWENLGDQTKAYLVKRIADQVAFAERKMVVDAGIQLRECV